MQSLELTCCREWLTENYSMVDGIVRSIARRHRLGPDEAEELASTVYLKLVDKDYAVLRQYRGRSSLSTYLTTVVARVLLDRRAAAWGRWRPSAEARRLGQTAIALERLVGRDGMPFDQACELLRTNQGVEESFADLERICASLPVRLRTRLVSVEELANMAAPDPAPVDGRYDRLNRSLEALPRRDRDMLRMVYEERKKVRDVARACNVDARTLYRRLDRLRASLKASVTRSAGAHA